MDSYAREVRTVGVVGLGTIGMNWAAYFLARGLSVRATDVDAAAEARTKAYIERGRVALDKLGLVASAARDATFSFHATVDEAVASCDFIQETGRNPKR